jgi:two-component system sensor histidine kinase YesM
MGLEWMLRVNELRKEIEMTAAQAELRFGLANVNNRIKLNYGNMYGLDIRSKKGEARISQLKSLQDG